MSVLAPTGELLSFAWPKKVTKEKATRPQLTSCAPKLLLGVGKRDFLSLCQLAASMQQPFGLFPAKASVLGAADGKIKEH
jgi:hypothetical protein